MFCISQSFRTIKEIYVIYVQGMTILPPEGKTFVNCIIIFKLIDLEMTLRRHIIRNVINILECIFSK